MADVRRCARLRTFLVRVRLALPGLLACAILVALVAAAFGLFGGGRSALAQDRIQPPRPATVPLAEPVTKAVPSLPQPAPKSRNRAARSLSPLPTDTAGRPIPIRPPESVPYDGSQRALVDRASNYLSSLQSLTGEFVQTIRTVAGRWENCIAKPGLQSSRRYR